MYQIFKYGEPISKPYPFKRQAFVDCVEKGLVVHAGGQDWFADGIEIRIVKDEKEK